MGDASLAPPGCLKVILGVNVYPLPEETTSRADTEPFVTVALIVGAMESTLVGASTTTVGGFVSLYPLPPLRRSTLLMPFTRAVADAPEPVSD